ncbi:MAG: hypothetical protein ACKVII_12255 [Planctomycetales bacterium]|jgi:hypothetical protein
MNDRWLVRGLWPFSSGPHSDRHDPYDRWTQSIFEQQHDIDLGQLVDQALTDRHNVLRPAVAMFP